MSSWGKVDAPIETMNFAEIMSEEYAHRLQEREVKAQGAVRKGFALTATPPAGAEAAKDDDVEGWEDYSMLLQPPEAIVEPKRPPSLEPCESDSTIAHMLQAQFDTEYNAELRRIEQQRNKQSKITVSLDRFRRINGYVTDEQDAQRADQLEDERKKDWDRFETNEKLFEAIPKCGYALGKDGDMITKHDPGICGVRNACRVMSFPPEFATGDGAGFDMKLSNRVYNQLKTYSRRSTTGASGKKAKMHERKENTATAEMGVDAFTRLIVFKLINNQVLEEVHGVISTGKEAVILHANSDPMWAGQSSMDEKSPHDRHASHPPMPLHLPKECAIKIFKTELNEFKQRDRYIKDDYRFSDRFNKQNNRVIISMWAEKEMHNLLRMRSVGLRCPDVVVLKKHVLVMSFIGENHRPAPKLKDARLSDRELQSAYDELVAAMHKLYNEAKLVHADMSEYNVLWHQGKCWIIDVAQSVEPGHPSALEFLMRDCTNIINFFTKRGLDDIFTKEELFEHITGLNADTHNAAMLERIHTRGASIAQATAPSWNQDSCPDELKPLSYPFDLAWEKSLADRQASQAKSEQKTPSKVEAPPAPTLDRPAEGLAILSVSAGTPTEPDETRPPSTTTAADN